MGNHGAEQPQGQQLVDVHPVEPPVGAARQGQEYQQGEEKLPPGALRRTDIPGALVQQGHCRVEQGTAQADGDAHRDPALQRRFRRDDDTTDKTGANGQPLHAVDPLAVEQKGEHEVLHRVGENGQRGNRRGGQLDTEEKRQPVQPEHCTYHQQLPPLTPGQAQQPPAQHYPR